jgi:hypothetical protein
MRSLILWGFLFWSIGFLFVMALMRMAGDEDRAARHEERMLDPLSDVPITQMDNGC